MDEAAMVARKQHDGVEEGLGTLVHAVRREVKVGESDLNLGATLTVDMLKQLAMVGLIVVRLGVDGLANFVDPCNHLIDDKTMDVE